MTHSPTTIIAELRDDGVSISEILAILASDAERRAYASNNCARIAAICGRAARDVAIVEMSPRSSWESR